QKDQSYVQIRDAAVAGFLATVGESMVLEKGARLTQLDTAPDLASKGPGPRRDAPAGDKPYRAKAPAARGPKPHRKRDDEKGPRRKDTTDRAPSGTDTTAKPKRKPKGPPPPKGKPDSKKNRARAAGTAFAKGPGKAGAQKRKPKGAKPGGGRS
ncbi:MAG: hypothetical protein ACU0CY_14115, partial [Maritimibacter harenae]